MFISFVNNKDDWVFVEVTENVDDGFIVFHIDEEANGGLKETFKGHFIIEVNILADDEVFLSSYRH